MTNLARMAVRAFPPTAFVPKAQRRSNQRKWLSAVASLGAHWLLANKTQKRSDHDKYRG